VQICGETLHRRRQQHSEINLLEADTAKENREVWFDPDNGHAAISAACPKSENPEVGLLDHLVGADHKGIRDCDPNCPRGLEVRRKLELCGLLHRKIARPLTA
jgi:hypothetical protein